VTQITNKEVGPDQIYTDYLKKQIFALPKCMKCKKYHFFPRTACPHCGSFKLEWYPVTGAGEVYSCTTIYRKSERGGNYNVSLITLNEGPRIMSRVEGVEPESVKIGSRVTASIDNETDEPFVIFTPTEIPGSCHTY